MLYGSRYSSLLLRLLCGARFLDSLDVIVGLLEVEIRQRLLLLAALLPGLELAPLKHIRNRLIDVVLEAEVIVRHVVLIVRLDESLTSLAHNLLEVTRVRNRNKLVPFSVDEQQRTRCFPQQLLADVDVVLELLYLRFEVGAIVPEVPNRLERRDQHEQPWFLLQQPQLADGLHSGT